MLIFSLMCSRVRPSHGSTHQDDEVRSATILCLGSEREREREGGGGGVRRNRWGGRERGGGGGGGGDNILYLRG